jgi:hypothetical protein
MLAFDATKQPHFTDAGNRTYIARSSRASSSARAQTRPASIVVSHSGRSFWQAMRSPPTSTLPVASGSRPAVAYLRAAREVFARLEPYGGRGRRAAIDPSACDVVGRTCMGARCQTPRAVCQTLMPKPELDSKPTATVTMIVRSEQMACVSERPGPGARCRLKSCQSSRSPRTVEPR